MPVTLIYDDNPSTLQTAEAAGEDLWLPLSDLTASTQWELKTEGFCRVPPAFRYLTTVASG